MICFQSIKSSSIGSGNGGQTGHIALQFVSIVCASSTYEPVEFIGRAEVLLYRNQDFQQLVYRPAGNCEAEFARLSIKIRCRYLRFPLPAKVCQDWGPVFAWRDFAHFSIEEIDKR